jgi:hypothetical protein
MPDYWSNSISNWNTAADGNDQRCTYNNCKNWDYAGGQTDNKTCTVCWGTADLADASWDVAATYTSKEVQGTILTEPFKLDDADKVCKIQCMPDYWSNSISNWNTAADGNDQRCTYNNCKNWDYAGGQTDNKTCTVCWAKEDLSDYANWDAQISYSIQEIEFRDIDTPFL